MERDGHLLCDQCGRVVKIPYKVAIDVQEGFKKDAFKDDFKWLKERCFCVWCIRELIGEMKFADPDWEIGEEPKEPPKREKTKNDSARLYDYGKIQALDKAGWSPKKIADEFGCEPEAIRQVLFKIRHGKSLV